MLSLFPTPSQFATTSFACMNKVVVPIDEFSQNMRTPYYVQNFFSYVLQGGVLTFPSLTSFCHFFDVEGGIYHKQKKGFRAMWERRTCSLMTDSLSLNSPSHSHHLCNKKIHWFHFVKQQPPTTCGLPTTTWSPTFGPKCLSAHKIDDDDDDDEYGEWSVAKSTLCMISPAVEILQQPNHQVETWDTVLSYHQVETWDAVSGLSWACSWG